MEIEARAWTTKLSLAESDISRASQKLEKVFKEANSLAGKSGGSEIPDPVKLVRRLTSLEIALGSLKNDCEAIATKRRNIVKEIIDIQTRNISKVQEMLDMTQEYSNSVNEDKMSQVDEQSWQDLTHKLNQQQTLLASTGDK